MLRIYRSIVAASITRSVIVFIEIPVQQSGLFGNVPEPAGSQGTRRNSQIRT